MARELDGTAPVGGGDALAAPVGYADAVRAHEAADALAVGAVPDALAAPADGWVAVGADPLTGYADATLLLGRMASPLLTPASPLQTPPPPPAAPPPPAGPVPPRGAGAPADHARGRPQPPGRPTPPAAPPPGAGRGGTGALPAAGGGGWAPHPAPGRPAGQPGHRQPGHPQPGYSQHSDPRHGYPPPAAPPRPDAISWQELTIRGRASADRRPQHRPPAPPAGWDSYFTGVRAAGGRAPWTGRQAPNSPQSLRELLDLLRRSARG